MQYMLIRKADADTERGALPSQDMLAAMAEYNERMVNAGVFVNGNGLRPSREGCRIRFESGRPTVIDGPFAEPEELVAGYSVLEVDSLDEAIEWARQWPPMDAGGNVVLELRRYFTIDDFEPGAGLDKHLAQARVPDAMNVHATFSGNCREAMAFYAEVTGGRIEAMIAYGETPAAAETPQDWHDKIVHASLNVRGRRLMGADMHGGGDEPPRGMQIQLEYQDVEPAEKAFRRLSEGGRVIMPFEQTFWAYRFGMVTDRFGIQWMINCQGTACPLASEGSTA